MMYTVTLVVALLLVVFLFSAVVGVYNQIVRFRHEVDNARANIEVQLQRRHDLIPSLVECVHGYSGVERDLIKHVADSHSRAGNVPAGLSDERMSREIELGTALLGLRQVIHQQFPQIKADASFARLELQLTEIEGRLAGSRQWYNDSVYRLAATCHQFPGSVLAPRAGITQMPPYFESDGEAHKAPKFSFDRRPATSQV